MFVCVALPSGARAGIVTGGASGAYSVSAGIAVHVPLVGTINVPIAAQPTVSGTAPAAYSQTGSAISVALGVVGTASVDAGVLNVAASSTVDGTSASGLATASSSVTGLGVLVGAGGALLSITSGTDVITETATASGSYGALTATGALTIVGTSNVVIDVLGSTVVTLTPGEIIAPNTTINVAGVGSIILNEQIADPGSNGTTFAGISTNFLDLNLSPSIPLGASATISIVVDHAHASLNAASSPSSVPEPSSLVLASLGVLAVLGVTFVRRLAP